MSALRALADDQPFGLGHRILSRDEERLLVEQAQAGNEYAADALASHNLKLVWSLTKKFWYGDRDDLFGIGCEAMLTAIHKFDSGKGYRLGQYLSVVCYRAMARSMVGDDAMSDPAAVWSIEELEEAGQHIAAELQTGPPEVQVLRSWLAELFSHAGLSWDETQAVAHRHGLYDGSDDGMSFRELAVVMGKSNRTTAHSIYDRGITKLRQAVAAGEGV